MSGGSPDNSGSTPDNGNAGSIPAPVDTNQVEGHIPDAGKEVRSLPDTIQKPKRGRPPTGFDKKAYDRAFMVKKRARLKLEREAAK